MSRVRSFLRLPVQRKLLLAEALVRLAAAWLLVRAVPFRLWSAGLGRVSGGEVVGGAPAPRALMAEVRWALRRVNRAVGGRLTCLMLAMAGKRMLARRGVPGTIVLGVRPGTSDAPDSPASAAHAWLRVGDTVLLGDEERPGFIPVASYSSD